MIGQSRQRPWVWLLTLAALAIGGTASFAQQPGILRLSRNIPGDSKPIVLYADDIATWSEGGQRIFVLKGKVFIEHGIVNARCQQAVVWVDENRFRLTHIYHADVYTEGEVQLENGPDTKNGPKALLDLNTRGELKIKSQSKKVAEKPQSNDPLVLRAQAERSPQAVKPATPPGPIQRTSMQQVIPAAAPAPAPGATTPTPVPPLVPPTSAPTPPSLLPPLPVPTPPAPVPAPTGAPPVSSQPMTPPAPPSPNPPATPPPPSSSSLQPGPPFAPPTPVPRPPDDPAAKPPGPQAGGNSGPPRILSIAPRTAAPFQTQSFPLATGEQAIVVTGGVILTVRNVKQIGIVDMEADKLVFWTKGNTQQLFSNMKQPQGHASRELEFYLAGNVEIRSQNDKKENVTLRADQVFYDVGRNVAVATSADLEFKQPRLPTPAHLKADELLQLSPNQFQVVRAELFSSRLPSDPGLRVLVSQATLEDKKIPKKTFWGKQIVDHKTGEPMTEPQRLFSGDDAVIKIENVPVFYLPRIHGDAYDPLGPLENISIGFNQMYGAVFGLTFNIFNLIGVDPPPGVRWRLNLDYLTDRGPGLGTDLDYAGKNLLDIPSRYVGLIKTWGINDSGNDRLGGPRDGYPHPDWRGRFTWRQNWWELPADITVQFQVSALSDKNFLEEFYKQEFDTDLNQDTFVYLKQQRGNWAWTLLGEERIRNWVTETEWLPRADGYLLGQDFLDLFTYNAHASAGYARLRVTHQPTFPTPPIFLTDVPTNTTRLDLWQEIGMPLQLGPFKVVPYGRLDLTYYSEDLNGDDRGRFYGAGGVRGSIPFTRLYPDVCSELLNLNGINHKIVVSSNYYIAHSDTPYTLLPQLDRLDDDATDQARRDITPLQTSINPQHGFFLANSILFNPQDYAIRRLVDNRIDTLDTIEELELDIRQRWQTKRGYPGMQHIVDWMTLDLSATYFPHPTRDDFGSTWGFLQYDWIWNLGDRTALVSNGWVDAIDQDVHTFNIGAFFNRPDRTSFYLGYRQIDPVNSRAVTASASYVFSPKYAITGATTYDFGIGQSLSNSLLFTRMGSDLQVSLGLTYNAILNTFGFTFEILPTLVAETQRVHRGTGFGSSVLGR